VNDDLQDVIKQADLLIKEGKFKSAWKLLLPYQDDPAARKRLEWLDQKRQRASQAGKEAEARPSSGRSRLYLVIAVVVILLLGILAVYGLSQRNPPLPTEVAQATSLSVLATQSASATPTPTELPPTENPREVSLQQQLKDWLATVEGVNQVLTFDVDIPGDEPPLAYVEIAVKPGFTDTRIPDAVVQKLNEVLNTTEYSDFVIIMNDGQRAFEYTFDSKNKTWEQVELSATPTFAD
jgi:hypothetical protein